AGGRGGGHHPLAVHCRVARLCPALEGSKVHGAYGAHWCAVGSEGKVRRGGCPNHAVTWRDPAEPWTRTVRTSLMRHSLLLSLCAISLTPVVVAAPTASAHTMVNNPTPPEHAP